MHGFGAIAVDPTGTGPRDGTTNLVLQVTAASYAVTASAVTFKMAENVSPAAFVIAPQGITLAELERVSAVSFAVSTFPASLNFKMPVAPASFVVTANPTTDNDALAVSPASIAVTFNDVGIRRTGADFDLVYGGVGHYLEEIERAKQLAAITRKPPPAVDLRSQPTFAPFGGAPVAPPRPQVDLAALAQQRMGAQMAAAQAAKKRRTEQAILLLAP